MSVTFANPETTVLGYSLTMKSRRTTFDWFMCHVQLRNAEVFTHYAAKKDLDVSANQLLAKSSAPVLGDSRKRQDTAHPAGSIENDIAQISPV